MDTRLEIDDFAEDLEDLIERHANSKSFEVKVHVDALHKIVSILSKRRENIHVKMRHLDAKFKETENG